MKRRVTLLALAWMVAAISSANAAPTLPGTGEAGLGNPDTNYALYLPGSIPGTAYGRAPHPAWVAAPAGYNWIGPSPESGATAADPAGTYCYVLNFSIPDLESVSGSWATDNSAEIFLNGVSTGITKGNTGYTTLSPFAITGGFTGNDTLLFRVHNLDDGAYPTGLLVTGLTTSTATIPAPAAILLGGIGTGLCGWLRRRRML